MKGFASDPTSGEALRYLKPLHSLEPRRALMTREALRMMECEMLDAFGLRGPCCWLDPCLQWGQIGVDGSGWAPGVSSAV